MAKPNSWHCCWSSEVMCCIHTFLTSAIDGGDWWRLERASSISMWCRDVTWIVACAKEAERWSLVWDLHQNFTLNTLNEIELTTVLLCFLIRFFFTLEMYILVIRMARIDFTRRTGKFISYDNWILTSWWPFPCILFSWNEAFYVGRVRKLRDGTKTSVHTIP